MSKGTVKNFIFFVPVIILLIGVFILYEKVDRRFGDTSAQEDFYKSPLVNKPLPQLNGTELFSKEPVTNDYFKGGYALVNVFSSWCVSCLEEHKLFKTVKFDGLKLIGIDWRDKEADAKAWLQKNGNPYDKVVFDDKGKYGIELGIRGVPETLLVSPEGNVLLHIRGNITEEFIADIANRLKAVPKRTQ